MIRDYRDIELTVERPTPIDKEVVWDKSKVISDDIVTVSDAMNEKRKSFFGRLFS